jgi:DNA-binding NarL/FixJ family response regulator
MIRTRQARPPDPPPHLARNHRRRREFRNQRERVAAVTNREIATEIYLSEKAVEYHLRNAYGKLGISSRRELRSLG